MSAETKRREILQMLAKGSISADEASELLGQLKNEPAAVPPVPEAPEPPQVPEPPPAPRGKPRWLNVRVTDAATQRDKVSVRIPLSLARAGLRMGAKFAPEIEEIEWDEVLSELSATDVGTLVEVQDEEDGEHVKIYIS
jgi:hypothetical protein